MSQATPWRPRFVRVFGGKPGFYLGSGLQQRVQPDELFGLAAPDQALFLSSGQPEHLFGIGAATGLNRDSDRDNPPIYSLYIITTGKQNTAVGYFPGGTGPRIGTIVRDYPGYLADCCVFCSCSFFTQAVAAGTGPNREQLFGFTAAVPRLPRQLAYQLRYFVFLWLLQPWLPG